MELIQHTTKVTQDAEASPTTPTSRDAAAIKGRAEETPLSPMIALTAQTASTLSRAKILFLTDYTSNFPHFCFEKIFSRYLSRIETKITLFFYSCRFPFVHPLMKILPPRKLLFFCFLSLQISEQKKMIPIDALFRLFLKLIVDPDVKLDTSISAQDRCYTVALINIEKFISDPKFEENYSRSISNMEEKIHSHVLVNKVSAVKCIWKDHLEGLRRQYLKMAPLASNLDDTSLAFEATLDLLDSAKDF